MKRARRSALWLAAALTCAFALLVALDALARPGGGGSFSGGSSGGGGGGHSSSGGDDLVGALLYLVFDVIFSLLPWPVKLAVIGFFVIVVIVAKIKRAREDSWSTDADDGPVAPKVARVRTRHERSFETPGSARSRLGALRFYDPDFSVVLFEDFLYALYAHVHYARGGGRLDRLSAYLAPAVLARMKGAATASVRTVLVGALRFESARGAGGEGDEVEVEVEIEANLSETLVQGGPEKSFYVLERWTLARKRDAKSRPPARARVLACPGCGAPLDAVVAGVCTHCKREVATGQLDWVVREARIVSREERGPMLTSDVEERGTDLPTVVDGAARERFAKIGARDPGVTWDAFQQRVGLVFRDFQTAWAARDLAKMRPYFTDALFDTQRYWVEAYRAQGLRNVTENARIEGIELARVTSDRWFDAVTVRVRATGLDYTLRDGSDSLVCGSRSRERRYTEYWTFIRSASRKGAPRTSPECPNCGAPLDVGMAGDCKYCRAKVTTGEFDWVLSRIEQDEVYQG